MTCDLCGGDPKCVLACYPQALSFEEVPDEEWEPFKSYAKLLVDRANGGLVPPPRELADEGIKPRRPV